jgi:hypothetical protein
MRLSTATTPKSRAISYHPAEWILLAPPSPVQDVRGVMGAQKRRAPQPTAIRQSMRSTIVPRILLRFVADENG